MEKFLIIYLLAFSNIESFSKEKNKEQATSNDCLKKIKKKSKYRETYLEKSIKKSEKLTDGSDLAKGLRSIFGSTPYLEQMKNKDINDAKFCSDYASFESLYDKDRKALKKAIEESEIPLGVNSFNAGDLGDYLFKRTTDLLTSNGINKDLLFSNEDFFGENSKELVLDLIDKVIENNKDKISSKASFQGLKSPSGCYSGSASLFKFDDMNEFTSSTKKNLKSLLNKERVRNDYTLAYCLPVLKLRQYCKSESSWSENATIACANFTAEAARDCFSGRLGSSIITIDSESDAVNSLVGYICEDDNDSNSSASAVNYKDNNISIETFESAIKSELKYVTTGDGYKTFIQTFKSQFDKKTSPEFVEVLDKNSQAGFSARFHALYSVCTTYREASQFILNEGVNFEEARQLGCKSKNNWTGDLNACVNSKKALMGVNQIGASVEATSLGIKSSLDQASLQSNYVAGVTMGDQTSAIDAQKEAVGNAKENALISSTFKTTQAGIFAGLSKSYPTFKKLQSSCFSGGKSIYGHQSVDCGMYYTLQADKENSSISKAFPNGLVNGQLIAQVGNNTGNAILELIKAGIYASQEKKIQAIDDEYEQFFDNEYQAQQVVEVDFCAQNPSAQGCSSSNVQTLDSGNTFGEIGFQNDGAGTFSFDNQEDLEAQDASMSPEQKRAVAELGNIMSNSKGNHIADSGGAPAAAKAKGAIGGGGGSAGGAGGSAGGAGSPGAKKAAKTQKTSFKTKKPSWNPAGGTRFSYKSGSKSKKRSNTFGDIFGKKKGRTVASDIDDISSSSSKLFEKISKRYTNLNSSKRLE